MTYTKASMEEHSTTYTKASAEVICFDNSDVITTSGLDGTNGCVVWSSQNGYECHDGLQMSGGDLNPPLS